MERESRAIYTVLDKLGVNADTVAWCLRNVKAINSFNNLKCKVFGVDVEFRTLGNFSDGTFREWLNSDIDSLHIYNHGLVFEDRSFAQGDQFHLMFTDEKTPPGYIKLEVLHKKETANVALNDSLTKSDFIFHKRDSFVTRGELKTNQRSRGSDFIYKVESHGPAEANRSPSLVNVEENIYAYRCGYMPEIASTWLRRCHQFRWPSSNDLEKLEQIPCHVVPMGHSHSDQREQEVQWKLSFTLHEQYIMTNLNDTQLKCFFLLKIFKEEIIKPGTKEFTMTNGNKGLKTYHCKTALFYTIQTNDQSIWVPERLIECLLLCLNILLQWLKDGFCPDFYIPKANLLDGKIEDEAHKSQIIKLVKHFVRNPLENLKNVKLNTFGKLFMHSLSSNQEELALFYDDLENDLAQHVLVYLTKTAVAAFDMCGYCFYYISENSKDIVEAVINHFYIMNMFSNFMAEQDQEIKDVSQQGFECFHISLASHLVLLAMKSDRSKRDWFMLASAFHFSKGLERNVYSGKLKLASVLLFTGHLKSTKNTLDDFDRNFDRNTQCINYGMACPVSEKEKEFCFSQLKSYGLKNLFPLSASLLLRQFLSAPVLFLPTEIDITPDALKLEMFRSIATAPDSMVQHLQYWHKWASVDVKVMLPFLKYLARHDLDLHSLQDVLNKSVSMNNYETPQNLLGWAAMNENETDLALMHFMQSWRICIRRTENLSKVFKIEKKFFAEHNAAKLWMLLLIFRRSRKENEVKATTQ